MTNGLDEYVNQDISGFANRYYDVGKFLFAVSTFAILATFTLRTTFGKDYDLVFVSIIFFFYCLYPSYKLTVGIDYEINPENTILKEYELKKKWMKEYLHKWAISFAIGAVVLILSFGYAMHSAKEEGNKIEHKLQNINKTLESILREMKKEKMQSTEVAVPCEADGNVQLSSQLFKLSEELSEHDARTQESFTSIEVHEDRHLQIIGSKIDRIVLIN